MRRRPDAYRGQVARTTSISSPVAGLNARDSIAAMNVKNAVLMENLWPEANSVRVRKGSSNWTTGITGQVQTMMAYAPRSGVAQFYGITTGGNIYNVSAAGAVGAAVVSGLTNGQWQYIQSTNSAGAAFLTLCNGVDTVRQYDGAAWTAPAITGPSATSVLVNITTHMNRIWFVEKNTMTAWYLATSAITGAATAFPLGPLFVRGGSLMAMGTWTFDSGNGAEDNLVIITTEGEIAVYAGTDPSSATTWQLRGVYFLAPPIGRKCLIKFGGDILLLTVRGIFPMSSVIQSVTINERTSISSIIDPLLKADYESYNSYYGWHLTLYPQADMLIVNVPTGAATSVQYCMNTLTKAWTKFLLLDFLSSVVSDTRLFLGCDTKTKLGWIGGVDGTATVQYRCVQAFRFFGADTSLKRWA